MERHVAYGILRRTAFGMLLCVLLVFATTHSFADDERYMKINRSIELFGRVYQEVINNYVDDVDPAKLIEAGIKGMLSTLDPYTVYIDERGKDEVDLLTTGRYGGIGITIGLRNGAITITSVTDGYAAQRQGLQIGDRILEIDGVPVNGLSTSDVRAMVRGEPGSKIDLLIEREAHDDPLYFTLVRESIRVQNISYAEFVADGIVYIRLDRFARGAGGETRSTLRELQRRQPIEGVILDLRNNSGGLLDAAVEVTNIFVPRGTKIVSTRGRTPDSVRRYLASQEPLLPDVPLVVLINENSASASEIVAGAIQDLDRGVLVGTQSFGKGLVQTVAHLTSDAQLKITTSRYYTPSGRSIQTAEYLRNAPKGLFKMDVDSLHTEFKTEGGRIVREGKGVTPDSIVVNPEKSPYVEQLDRRAMFFQFATKIVHSKEFDGKRPHPDDELLNRFAGFLDEQGFEYRDISEEKLEELYEIARQGNYATQFFDNLDVLRKYIVEEKEHIFERHREEIRRALANELASRYGGDRGRIEAELEHDLQFLTAVEIIQNVPLYQNQLSAAN